MDQNLFRNALLLPIEHIKQTHGKQIRPKLIKAFNFWCKVPDEKVIIIQDIIEILHNASLLIDDIEDNSVLRRGQPVAHLIYGVPKTINCANYFYFVALQKIIDNFPSNKVTECINIFSKRMLNLHEGQGLDIYWRDAQICPTMEQYKHMINLKTTALFFLALELLQVFSEENISLSGLCSMLGEYFQIRDDYANLKLGEYARNKSFCEDLTEGKYSFPIVHAIQNNPKDETIKNILKLKTQEIEIKKFAITHLEKLGSFEYTFKEMEQLFEKILNEIKRLGGNPLLEEALKIINLPQNNLDQL